MKALISLAKPLSWASLLLIVIPTLLNFYGTMSEAMMNHLLLAGTMIWFVTASLWMKAE